MNLNDYQALAMRTAKQGIPSEELNHAALGIAGEAGELCDSVKRALVYGRPLDRENLLEEIGDCLWYLALACRAAGFKLEDAAQANLAKLRMRYPAAYSDELAAARLDKVGGAK